MEHGQLSGVRQIRVIRCRTAKTISIPPRTGLLLLHYLANKSINLTAYSQYLGVGKTPSGVNELV
jgi:hypothetical protein